MKQAESNKSYHYNGSNMDNRYSATEKIVSYYSIILILYRYEIQQRKYKLQVSSFVTHAFRGFINTLTILSSNSYIRLKQTQAPIINSVLAERNCIYKPGQLFVVNSTFRNNHLD